jgi:hypothetical protein
MYRTTNRWFVPASLVRSGGTRAPGQVAQLGELGEGGGVDGDGGRAELVGQEVGEGGG